MEIDAEFDTRIWHLAVRQQPILYRVTFDSFFFPDIDKIPNNFFPHLCPLNQLQLNKTIIFYHRVTFNR